jgi:LuxR family transcriptional regulator, maltose regulon positive regulatory protein
MPTGHVAALPRPELSPNGDGIDAGPLGYVIVEPPAPRSGFVARPNLVQRLVESGDAALTLIVAPPGYGKSTLLTQWDSRDARPFVWLAAAGHERGASTTPMPPWAKANSGDLAGLIRSFRDRHASFVAVLDDAHDAPDTATDSIEAALQEVPPGSTIALASRTEPALPTGRFRAHRLVHETRTPQLAMGRAEAAALMRLAGIEPASDVVQRLVSRTEGWPAALYLAALAMREDPEDAVGFGGQHHLLADYLTDEVLSALPAELLSFAMRTSVLDELSGPSCDAVLEEHGSALLLDHLARINPLLIPVDAAHHTYRWHRLMAEVLRAELERIEPELAGTIRLRASRWFSVRGNTRRAIDQAAAAGAAELTGRLLWQNILGYVSCGQNDLVTGWLGNFSRNRIATHAPLALSAALSALVAGNLGDAQHWSLAARATLERGNGGGGNRIREFTTGLAVIDAASGHAGIRRMSEVATEAVEVEPENSPWGPLCYLLQGVGRYLQGERDGADTVLAEGIRLSGHEAPAVTSLCLAQRAMIAIDREDWELGAEFSDAALRIIERCGLTAEPVCAIAFAAAAASRAHGGRIDEAKRNLRTGIDLLAALEDFAPWYDAQARILLAHASLWLADAVGARTLLAEASRFARRTTGATIFSGWFDRAWLCMDTLAESSLAGPSSLTIAELRILRFLPSHRSFREIAQQLGVSANTVKTQAHAIYRKLGAASRSEAVAQARVAGLLGQ